MRNLSRKLDSLYDAILLTGRFTRLPHPRDKFHERKKNEVVETYDDRESRELVTVSRASRLRVPRFEAKVKRD